MSWRDAFKWTGLFRTDLERAREEIVESTIANATGPVRVRGTVVAPESPLAAPFTGAACVFWAAELQQRATMVVSAGTNTEREQVIWRQLFRCGYAMPFEIVDETGARARIVVPAVDLEAPVDDPLLRNLEVNPDIGQAVRDLDPMPTPNADWNVEDDCVVMVYYRLHLSAPLAPISDDQHLNELGPELDAFLRRRGVSTTRYMGLLNENRFHEATIRVGSVVEVIGNATEELGDAGTGYRDVARVARIDPWFVVGIAS